MYTYRITSNYSTRCLDLFLRGAMFGNLITSIFTAIFYMKLGLIRDKTTFNGI